MGVPTSGTYDGIERKKKSAKDLDKQHVYLLIF
jgi:hypothetical protein